MEVVNISTPGIIPKTKKRRSLVLLQLFVVAVLLATVWFSFGQNVLAPAKPAGVPEQLGDMKLDKFVEGAQALTQVNQMHGISIGLASAYIADYSHAYNPYLGNNERVTVWVGVTESSDAAAELLMRMVAGITKDNSGFSNLQRLTIADHEVFRVDGPGGEHFFYNPGEPGRRVVWLTIEAANALPILEQALKNF